MSTIGLVHLVWAPLGPAPVRRFLRSYRAIDAGADHELVIVLNGDEETVTRRWLAGELSGLEHRLVVLERPLLDLPAYAHAAGLLDHEHVCILNSHSEVISPGWLRALHAAHAPADVGLVGATGSWESQADWARGRMAHRIYDLLRLASLRRRFDPFPNPHLRSNGFLMARELLLEMDFDQAHDKAAAYDLESGRNGMTRRVAAAGLRTLVVGRDEHAYEPEAWPGSRTFRSADQQNLLVADNQTRSYDQASARERARLRRATWGPAATEHGRLT